MSSPVDLGQFVNQKVIGFSTTKTKISKRSTKTESLSVGVQAWEIAALIAAAGIYDFANGPNTVVSWLDKLFGYNPSTGQVSPGSLLSISGPSNPAQWSFYDAIYGASQGVQGAGGWLEKNASVLI